IILKSVLELSTDLLGRILGSRLVRKHFHLLLSGMLLFGPAFSLWASNYSILTNANNYLYRKFLKSVWGWTFLLSGSFIILLSLSSHCSFFLCLRHLSRIILVGFLWVGCRKGLTLLEDTTGSCYEPVDSHISSSSSSSSSLLLLHEDQTKSSCLRANLQWRGYEVSQEVLVLCLSSLLLVEEISVFGRHVAQMKTPDPSLRIIFLLCVVLLLLWMFLLLCLLAYFPKFPSQQLGGALGYLGWRVLYQGWYQLGPSWSCPGLPEPGPGALLTSKDSEKHKLCVE
uniref:Fat storage-inducing transmembrane protein 1 homolog n=1 Tax=Gouania willdenowi TaxID=441366 RepID=A0A8C5GPP6_GOUWI